MSNRVKYWVAFCFFGILFFHFIFILIYASPVKSINSKLVGYSQKYVYPYFHQSWSLFVPTPTTNNILFVKTKSNPKWQVLFPLRKKNRFIGNDAISLLFSSAIVYELSKLPCKSTFYKYKPSNIEFEILNKEITALLKQQYNLKASDSFDLLLLSSNNKEGFSYLFENLN